MLNDDVCCVEASSLSESCISKVSEAMIEMATCRLGSQLDRCFLKALQGVVRATAVKLYFVEPSLEKNLALRTLSLSSVGIFRESNLRTSFQFRMNQDPDDVKRYKQSFCCVFKRNDTYESEMWFAWFGFDRVRVLLKLLRPSSELLDVHDKVITLFRGYGHLRGGFDVGRRDEWTGLLNRRMFNAYFDRRQVQSGCVSTGGGRRASGVQQLSWLAMLDLKNLAQLNALQGSLLGDDILLFFSRLMKRHFRISDRLFRFGGKDFFVLFRAPEAKVAVAVIERFQLVLQRSPLPGGRQCVTCAAGITQIAYDDDAEQALSRAMSALLFAKECGGVCEYSELCAGASDIVTEEVDDSQEKDLETMAMLCF